MDLGLTNKVAIITGGSDGIGRAAAHRMAKEGARVVIVARRPDVLRAAADDIQTSTNGGRCHVRHFQQNSSYPFRRGLVSPDV